MKKRPFISSISTLLLALVLFCFQLGFSQLKATITDELGNPLEYATAAVYNSNGTLVSGVVSEARGIIEFGNLKSGKYNLEVSFIGYEVSKISNILFDEVLNLGTIKLTLGNQLDDVVIATKRTSTVCSRCLDEPCSRRSTTSVVTLGWLWFNRALLPISTRPSAALAVSAYGIDGTTDINL